MTKKTEIDVSGVSEEHKVHIGKAAVTAAISEANHIIGSHVLGGFQSHPDVTNEIEAHRFAFKHMMDNHT